MKNSNFQHKFPGKLLKTQFLDYPDGPLGESRTVTTSAFVPNPLPPDVDWDAIRLAHFERHSNTLLALGKVNGLHKRVGNAAGLLRTLWMREAKLSSEIEDIHTTAEGLVLAGAGRSTDVRESSRESWNYVSALEHGIQSDLPWSVRIIREMHELLLQSVRGQKQRPGKFRDGGVYIGGNRMGVENARFVPPPAN